MNAAQIPLSILLASACFWVMATDLTRRHIGNSVLLVIFSLSGIYSLLYLTQPAVLLSLGIASLIGVGLWVTQIWGGGDAKLLMAMSLLFEPMTFIHGMVWVGLFGGIVALSVLIKRRWQRLTGKHPKPQLQGLPFGIAIILGLGWQLGIVSLTQ